MRILNLLLLSSFLVFALPMNVRLQGSNEGRVSGMVFDMNDARVAGAKVIIESEKNKHQLATTEEGEFQLNLPPGKYSLTVESNGFCKFQRDALQITSGVTEMLNIHLEVAGYDSREPCKCTSRPRRDPERSHRPDRSIRRRTA